MTAFTQTRADEIVAALANQDVATFTSAVAFAPGVRPTADAVAAVAFPADFAIDASTFAGGPASGKAAASGAGQQINLALIVQNGAWKLDSTGSSETIVAARAGANEYCDDCA